MTHNDASVWSNTFTITVIVMVYDTLKYDGSVCSNSFTITVILTAHAIILGLFGQTLQVLL